MFFRAPCNNPLVNCWLLQEWDRQLRLQNVTKASQKSQKSHCSWSLRGVSSFSFPCFVEKFCFGCISRSLKVLNCITVALGKMSQVIQSHKNSLHFRWGFLQDGLPRQIVLKELSDSSDSRLFRVYRGWFCPRLYRDCTWPIVWGFFWWFSRRDLALSPNDRWRFIEDHGEIHHPKKRSLVGHDLPTRVRYVWTFPQAIRDGLKKHPTKIAEKKQRRWIGFGKCQAEAPETSTKAFICFLAESISKV